MIEDFSQDWVGCALVIVFILITIGILSLLVW